tara:strand:+ start:191 stop:346 length:156 start_codon:yes stop_codon:yes gene_type:complete
VALFSGLGAMILGLAIFVPAHTPIKYDAIINKKNKIPAVLTFIALCYCSNL